MVYWYKYVRIIRYRGLLILNLLDQISWSIDIKSVRIIRYREWSIDIKSVRIIRYRGLLILNLLELSNIVNGLLILNLLEWSDIVNGLLILNLLDQISSSFSCSMIWDEKWFAVLLILGKLFKRSFHKQHKAYDKKATLSSYYGWSTNPSRSSQIWNWYALFLFTKHAALSNTRDGEALLGVKIMFPSVETCLSVNCCFS